jgi:hypothetical protein
MTDDNKEEYTLSLDIARRNGDNREEYSVLSL